jgi:hypothetical protein
MRFERDEGRVVAAVADCAAVELKVVDLSRESSGRCKWRRLRRDITASVVSSFDIGALPLLRPTLFHLGGFEHVLVVVTPHTIWDGQSAAIFIADFARAVTAVGATNDGDQTEHRPGQLRDVWRDAARGASHASPTPGRVAMTYRGRQLRPCVQDFIGLPVTPSGPVDALEDVAAARGSSVASALAACTVLLAAKLRGKGSLVLGFHWANRDSPGRSDVIGYVAEHILVSVDAAAMPFVELVGTIGRSVRYHRAAGRSMAEAFPRQKKAGPWRAESTCDVSSNFVQTGAAEAWQAAGSLLVRHLIAPVWMQTFPVDTLWDYALLDTSTFRNGRGGVLGGTLGYNARAIDRDEAVSLSEDYSLLVRAAARAPASQCSDLLSTVGRTKSAARRQLTVWGTCPTGAIATPGSRGA